ncbi:MAG: flagellar basal body-associated FliL family protein [Erysipelotrichaceae bacterium]|nr:flagellar basal body-associated FliL family protein [Erysipelotrichaceae bacterium]
MTERDTRNVAEPKPPRKKSGRKLIIITVLLMIVGGGASFGGYYVKTGQILFGLDRFIIKPMEEKTFQLDSFLVNLRDERATRYLKTTIALSYMEDDSKMKIEQQVSQIRDVVIQYLRGLSQKEIAEANSLEVYRFDLLTQINQIFDDEIVYNLYFTDFLIQ